MSVSSSSANRNAVELRRRTAWIFGPISKVADGTRPCALGQGFYFNTPMMPAEIRKLLTAAAVEKRARVPRGVSEGPAT